MRARNLTLGAAAVATTAGAAAAIWGVLVERHRFTVRHEVLPLLPAGAASIRVLHLSDVHLAPWQRTKQEWLHGLAEQVRPDLVINTGDNLGHPGAYDALEAALAPLAGTPGVYVHGSNDYHAPRPKNPLGYLRSPSSSDHNPSERLDVQRLESFFDDALGWTSLNNRAATLQINGSRLDLTGTNDAHLGWDRLGSIPAGLEVLREDDDEHADAVTIGVTHAPYRRVLDAFVTHGADLIVAGHTHGGQVCVPGLGALVTNCDLPASYASGLHRWYHARGSADLEISAGIGTSIYAPVRFACRPEAVVLELTARNAA